MGEQRCHCSSARPRLFPGRRLAKMGGGNCRGVAWIVSPCSTSSRVARPSHKLHFCYAAWFGDNRLPARLLVFSASMEKRDAERFGNPSALNSHTAAVDHGGLSHQLGRGNELALRRQRARTRAGSTRFQLRLFVTGIVAMAAISIVLYLAHAAFPFGLTNAASGRSQIEITPPIFLASRRLSCWRAGRMTFVTEENAGSSGQWRSAFSSRPSS